MASSSSAVSMGRVSERPEGRRCRAVKSPMMRTAVWPASWNWRSLRSTTVWPSVRSGRLGSTPSFTRSGRPERELLLEPALRDDLHRPAAQRDQVVGGWRRMLPSRLRMLPAAGPPGSGPNPGVHSPAMKTRRALPLLPCAVSSCSPRRIGVRPAASCDDYHARAARTDLLPVRRGRLPDHRAARHARTAWCSPTGRCRSRSARCRRRDRGPPLLLPPRGRPAERSPAPPYDERRRPARRSRAAPRSPSSS